MKAQHLEKISQGRSDTKAYADPEGVMGTFINIDTLEVQVIFHLQLEVNCVCIIHNCCITKWGFFSQIPKRLLLML